MLQSITEHYNKPVSHY